MNKKTYYLLSLTWGLPLTMVGGVVGMILRLCGIHPARFGFCLCFEIGRKWGGLNLGLVILCQRGASDALRRHEHGHAIQNCYFGPLIIPLVFGSAARYHYYNRMEKMGNTLPPYDSWWFEGQATALGNRYFGVKGG